jgi:DNA-binding CsgD family transcriptional regulator
MTLSAHVHAPGRPATPAAALGFVVAGEGSAATVVFVGLDDAESCPRCTRPAGAATAGRLLRIGYVAGPPALAAAHRLHACCDVVLVLRASGGRPRFAYPPPDLLAGTGLSAREADILVLVLAGGTDAEIAARLCVAPATARAHARAVLRKLGAADRRALRARLLRRPPPGAGG